MPVKLRFFPSLRPVFFALLCALPAVGRPAAFAQTPQPEAPGQAAPSDAIQAPSSIVQPALANVRRSIGDINIQRWKAPGEVRNATQQNANSIQNDLNNTLPGLLTQADAAPGSVTPSFALYRNLDALYDVLLRIYETSVLAAPQNEVDELSLTLQRVEDARSQLGDAILHASQQREAELGKLQAQAKAAAAGTTQAAPAKTSVVDDGPTPAQPSAHKKKKPAAKPAQTTQQQPTPPPA